MDTPEEIRASIRQVTEIHRTAEELVRGFESEFWQKLKEKIRTQLDVYEDECDAAAGKSDTEIKSFIGRKAGLKWLLKLPDEARETLKNSHELILTLQEQLKDVELLTKGITEDLSLPMYSEPGLI